MIFNIEYIYNLMIVVVDTPCYCIRMGVTAIREGGRNGQGIVYL